VIESGRTGRVTVALTNESTAATTSGEASVLGKSTITFSCLQLDSTSAVIANNKNNFFIIGLING
jgi:hypothetical protein